MPLIIYLITLCSKQSKLESSPSGHARGTPPRCTYLVEAISGYFAYTAPKARVSATKTGCWLFFSHFFRWTLGPPGRCRSQACEVDETDVTEAGRRRAGSPIPRGTRCPRVLAVGAVDCCASAF